MRVSFVALLFVLAATFGAMPASAQEAAQDDSLQSLIEAELPPERLELAMKLVHLSGTTRVFDAVLPDIADQAKNRFIRANPQMQLGIIAVVDKIALQLVSRRPELDEYLAKVWAAGFSDAELQELVDFYGTDVGKKFSATMPQILAVQTAAAQEWGKSVSEELNLRVQEELRAAIEAEQEALQSDIAGPADGEAPAPQQ